jgi:putative transposase
MIPCNKLKENEEDAVLPRPLRILYPGAWYHVMNRGAGYQNIFHSEKHKHLFLSLLGEASGQFNIQIHAYCLMDNHYHLLVHTPQGNLSRAMRHINGVYTQRYNREEKTDGPLFRGRYKAILVQKDNYIQQVSRYIHLNPVEAQICRNAESFSWSSYQFYLQSKNKPVWLHLDFVLGYFGKKNSRDKYRNFVELGLDDEIKYFYSKKNKSVIMGDDKFKEMRLDSLEKEYIQDVKIDYRHSRTYLSKERIFELVASYFKITQDEILKSQRGKENIARMVAMYFCKHKANLSLKEIAQIFNMKSHTAVSDSICKVEKSDDARIIKSFKYLENI